MQEVGSVAPTQELFNNVKLSFSKSKVLFLGGGMHKAAKGEGQGRCLPFGFCHTQNRRRPWAVRPVLLPEGSQSWRVKSLRACVIWAAQASSSGGGVGEGEGAVHVKRDERAWDAGGKEGEWAGRCEGWRQQ